MQGAARWDVWICGNSWPKMLPPVNYESPNDFNTSEKLTRFMARVVNTGAKFITGVIDNGGKFATGCNLPSVSMTPVVHLDLRISLRVFEKIQISSNGILGGLRENDSQKIWSKKSCDNVCFRSFFCLLLLQLNTGEICLLYKGQDNPASFNLSALLSFSEVLHFNRFQILISSLKGTVHRNWYGWNRHLIGTEIFWKSTCPPPVRALWRFSDTLYSNWLIVSYLSNAHTAAPALFSSFTRIGKGTIKKFWIDSSDPNWVILWLHISKWAEEKCKRLDKPAAKFWPDFPKKGWKGLKS